MHGSFSSCGSYPVKLKKKKKGFPHSSPFIVRKAAAHLPVGLGIRNKRTFEIRFIFSYSYMIFTATVPELLNELIKHFSSEPPRKKGAMAMEKQRAQNVTRSAYVLGNLLSDPSSS